jgi:hypothetical protein
MADDRYSWLDEEAAERMLRGESADAAVGGDDARARADAERLVLALADALAETSGDRLLGAEADAALPGEFPGEAAAAAAFRKATESRAGSPRPGSAGEQQAAHTSADCPIARRSPAHRIPPPSWRPGEEVTEPAVSRQVGPIGQRVWPFRSGRLGQLGRPLRAGLAVAIAGCALGGVAVATGMGVLPLPFGDGSGGPVPAASVSATTGPYGSAPGTGENGHTGGLGASASGESQETGGSGRSGGRGASSGGLAGESAGTGNGRPEGAGQPSAGPGKSAGETQTVIALCRRHEAGTLGASGRRRLEQEAGGRQAVDPYCDRLLDEDGGDTGSGSGPGSGPSPDSVPSPSADDSGSGGTSGEGGSGGEVPSRHTEQHSAELRSAAPVSGETPVPAPVPAAGMPAPMPAEKPAPASSGGSLDLSASKRPVR